MRRTGTGLLGLALIGTGVADPRAPDPLPGKTTFSSAATVDDFNRSNFFSARTKSVVVDSSRAAVSSCCSRRSRSASCDLSD